MFGISFFELVIDCVSTLGEGHIQFLRVVDVKDGDSGDQMLHGIDEIQHFVVELGVVECNKGRIENMLSFHIYITTTFQPTHHIY